MGEEGAEVKKQRLGKEVNLSRQKEKRKEWNKEGWHFSGLLRRRINVSGKNYICSLLSKLRLVH